MMPNPVTLYADEPLVHAVGRFSQLRFGRFPVVNREGELVGIITQGDIVRAMLKRLEVDYHEEEIHRYRASHIFEDILADQVALGLRLPRGGRGLYAGRGSLQRAEETLTRLGIHPHVIRRVAVATYEAEMNIVIHTEGGEIVAEVRPDHIKIEATDHGPGIPDIERAMQPGFPPRPSGCAKWASALAWGCPISSPALTKCS